MYKIPNSRFSETVVLLGAGYSKVAGVPLASELLEEKLDFAWVRHQRVFEEVLESWHRWQVQTGGTPEQFMAHLFAEQSPYYHKLKHFIGLRILHAQDHSTLLEVASHTKHDAFHPELPGLDRERAIEPKKSKQMRKFRGSVRSSSTFYHHLLHTVLWEVRAFITLNYDVVLERSFDHIDYGLDYVDSIVQYPKRRRGTRRFYRRWGPFLTPLEAIERASEPFPIPRRLLLKLHGSLNWRWVDETLHEKSLLIIHSECEPVRRGDPFIIPPVQEKRPLAPLRGVWQHAAEKLQSCSELIIFGTSLPHYDYALRALITDNLRAGSGVIVVNPDERVAQHVAEMYPQYQVTHYPDHWSAFYGFQRAMGLANKSLIDIYEGDVGQYDLLRAGGRGDQTDHPSP